MTEETTQPPTELAQKPPEPTGPLAQLMKYTQDPETKRRIQEMLGDAAGTFTNSLINVVKGSPQLMGIARQNPGSIMTSALRAASVRLPIDPSLGFAAIVPYGGNSPAAQFQLMYKGLIQLAIRTGQYRRMHDTVVYKDELEDYNPITGVVEFTDPSAWKMRATKNDEDVAGFYFEFELTTGFVASKFLSFDDAMAWGRKYSKAYQSDLQYKKQASLWSTNPIAMGLKTCIKTLLGKYGILSVEMQQAIVADDEDFAGSIIDNETGEPIRGVAGVKETLKARKASGKTVSSVCGDGESSKAQGSEPEPGKDQGHGGADDTRESIVQPPPAPLSTEEAEQNAAEKFGKPELPPETEPEQEELFVCLMCKSKSRQCEYTAAQIAEAAGKCPRCLTAKDLVPKSEAEDAPASPKKEPKATVRCLACKKEYPVKPAACECGSRLGFKKL